MNASDVSESANKEIKICQECNINPARITSYALFQHKNLCVECYKKLLEIETETEKIETTEKNNEKNNPATNQRHNPTNQ